MSLLVQPTDGWYINLRLQDDSIPDFKSNIVPSWNNSLGMDAVLHENDYLATSEGVKLPSLKSFRKSQSKLASVSKHKAARKKGSKQRRKLALREARLHQQIARARKDHAYNTAHALLKTGKKVFFHEKLNLAGFSVSYMKVPVTRNYFFAAMLLAGAAYLIFSEAKTQ